MPSLTHPLPRLARGRATATALGTVFALALSALPIAAQTDGAPMPLSEQNAQKRPPAGGFGKGHMMMHGTVSAQGSGSANVAPDLATVSLGVTTQAPTAAQAMADNATQQQAVIDALKKNGIAPEDMQTQGLNLSPQQDYSNNQAPKITGYQAQNIVTVRVKDLPKLGPLLDAMVAAGATDVQSISFSREDDSATYDEARTAAVADARHRAEVMATAAGMELGPLVSLSEGGDFGGGPAPMAMMAQAKAASTPVETGQLQLSSQVKGVWMLMPKGGSTPTDSQPSEAATDQQSDEDTSPPPQD